MARNDADMTHGSIGRHFLSFSLPLAIGLTFQQLYNTVDSVVVGQYVGQEALAAVGSTGSIINMLIALCNGLSLGAGVLISQCYGAHNHQRLHTAVQTTITVAFLLCAVATAVGLSLVKPLLRMMQTPDNVFGESEQYLSLYFCGISGLLLYNVGSAILRAVGDSKRPLFFLVFSALTNTALDLLFVVQFGMGVRGVALATIMAQGLSAVLVLVTLTREKGAYGIRWRELGISRPELKSVLSMGAPTGLQQALTSFSNVFVQSYINAFGSACMAGWNGYNKLDAFLTVPVMAIAQASTTFVGQNWGANNPRRARKGVRFAVLAALGCMAVLAVLLMCFAGQLMHLFSPDAEVIDYGVRFIRIITPFYLTICFNQIFAGALRGTGDARTPMLIMLGSFVVFRQAYLLVSSWLGWGFVGVALAYPLGWVVCSTLLTVCYHRSALYHLQRNVQQA
ncbi:MAG: MATE family efflux transporter [Aristaeellaceae bacterium]